MVHAPSIWYAGLFTASVIAVIMVVGVQAGAFGVAGQPVSVGAEEQTPTVLPQAAPPNQGGFQELFAASQQSFAEAGAADLTPFSPAFLESSDDRERGFSRRSSDVHESDAHRGVTSSTQSRERDREHSGGREREKHD